MVLAFCQENVQTTNFLMERTQKYVAMLVRNTPAIAQKRVTNILKRLFLSLSHIIQYALAINKAKSTLLMFSQANYEFPLLHSWYCLLKKTTLVHPNLQCSLFRLQHYHSLQLQSVHSVQKYSLSSKSSL